MRDKAARSISGVHSAATLEQLASCMGLSRGFLLWFSLKCFGMKIILVCKYRLFQVWDNTAVAIARSISGMHSAASPEQMGAHLKRGLDYRCGIMRRWRSRGAYRECTASPARCHIFVSTRWTVYPDKWTETRSAFQVRDNAAVALARGISGMHSAATPEQMGAAFKGLIEAIPLRHDPADNAEVCASPSEI